MFLIKFICSRLSIILNTSLGQGGSGSSSSRRHVLVKLAGHFYSLYILWQNILRGCFCLLLSDLNIEFLPQSQTDE